MQRGTQALWSRRRQASSRQPAHGFERALPQMAIWQKCVNKQGPVILGMIAMAAVNANESKCVQYVGSARLSGAGAMTRRRLHQQIAHLVTAR